MKALDLNALTIVPTLRGPFSTAEATVRKKNWNLQSDPTHRSQVFMNMDIALTADAGIANFGCNMRASAIYDIGLDANGTLTATTAIDFSKFPVVGVSGGSGYALPDYTKVAVDAYAGGGCEDLLNIQHGGKWLMRFFLNVFIPQTITSALHLLQTIRDPFQLPCDPTVGPAFDPLKMGDALFGASDVNGTTCLSSQVFFCDRVNLGFRNAGHSPTSRKPTLTTLPVGCFPVPGVTGPNADDLLLQRLLSAVVATDENGRFLHWRCTTPCPAQRNQNIGLLAFQTLDLASPPNFDASKCTPHVGSCDFVVPVKRIIMNPDTLMLVYADELDEWDNAAVAALYVAAVWPYDSLGVHVPLSNDSLRQYARRTSGAFFHRPYAVFRAEPQSCQT